MEWLAPIDVPVVVCATRVSATVTSALLDSIALSRFHALVGALAMESAFMASATVILDSLESIAVTFFDATAVVAVMVFVHMGSAFVTLDTMARLASEYSSARTIAMQSKEMVFARMVSATVSPVSAASNVNRKLLVLTTAMAMVSVRMDVASVTPDFVVILAWTR